MTTPLPSTKAMDHQEAMHIITDVSVYRTSVAIPYIDALIRNMTE